MAELDKKTTAETAQTSPETEDASGRGRISLPHALFERGFELEMLISGVLLFGATSLPSNLDKLFDYLLVTMHAGTALFTLANMLLQLLQGVTMVLIVGLGMHLIMRSLWVGVVGIESIYPNGPIAERMRGGNIYKELQKEAGFFDIDLLEQRLDRTSRLLFGLIFCLIVMFCGGMVQAVVALLASVAMEAILGFGFVMSFVTGFALIFVPIMIMFSLDRYGERLPVVRNYYHHAGFRRVVKGYYKLYMYISLLAFVVPLYNTLYTNLTRRVFMSIVLVGATVLYVGVFKGLIRLEPMALVPDNGGPLEMNNGRYDNRRNEEQPLFGPMIQSEVISGAYLQLTLPFQASLQDTIMRRDTSIRPFRRLPMGLMDLVPRMDDTAQVRKVLEGYAALFEVKLDRDSVLTGLRFRFSELPDNGQQVIVAMIPMARLAEGEHLLELTPQYVTKRSPTQIPFWVSRMPVRE